MEWPDLTALLPRGISRTDKVNGREGWKRLCFTRRGIRNSRKAFFLVHRRVWRTECPSWTGQSSMYPVRYDAPSGEFHQDPHEGETVRQRTDVASTVLRWPRSALRAAYPCGHRCGWHQTAVTLGVLQPHQPVRPGKEPRPSPHPPSWPHSYKVCWPISHNLRVIQSDGWRRSRKPKLAFASLKHYRQVFKAYDIDPQCQ